MHWGKGGWRRAVAAAAIAAAGAATAVAIAAPQQFVGLTVSGTVSQPLDNVTVATFKSDGTITDASGYTTTIAWGDATHSTGTVVRKEPYTSPPFFYVTGSHTYTSAGDKTTTIFVKQGASTSTANGLARIATVPTATTPTTTTPTTTTPTTTTPTTTTPPPAKTHLRLPAGPGLRFKAPAHVRAGHRARLRVGAAGGAKGAFYIWRLGSKQRKRAKLAVPGAPHVRVAADAVTKHPWLDITPSKGGLLDVGVTAIGADGGSTQLNSSVSVAAGADLHPHAPALALSVQQPSTLEGTPVTATVDVVDKGCCTPSPKSKVKVSIDWGDGTVTQGTEATHAFAANQKGGSTITAKVTTPNGTASQDFTVFIDEDTDDEYSLCDGFNLEGIEAQLTDANACLAPFWSGSGSNAEFLAPPNVRVVLGSVYVAPPAGASILFDRAHATFTAFPFGSGPLQVARLFGKPALSGDVLSFAPDEGGAVMSGGTLVEPLAGNGLQLDGEATLHLPTQGLATVEGQAHLPAPFAGTVAARMPLFNTGSGVSGASLRTAGAPVAHAAALDLTIPDVAFGPIEAHDVHLVSDDSGLHGTGKLVVEGSELDASFDFGPGGEFQGARIFLGAEVPIFPMVALTNIDLQLTLDPFHFKGAGDIITNGPLELFGHPLLRFHGCFDVAVPQRGQTVRLCKAVDPGYVDYTEPYDHEVIVALTGSGKIIDLFDTQWAAVTVRVGGDEGPVVGFASGYDLHFPSDDVNAFSFDGSFGALVSGLSFNKWQLTTDNEVCLLDLACTGIHAIVSSKGISGCVGPAGGYYLWNHAWGASIVGCKFGKHYGSKAKVASALPGLRDALTGGAPGAFAAASGGLRVRLGAGVQSLRLDGVGGAPRVTITGPGGFRFADDGTGRTTKVAQVMHSETRDIVRDGKTEHMVGTDQTFLTLMHARPGVYTVTAQPGSSPIKTYALAGRAAPPVIRARVRGGRLVYRIVRGVPGSTVTFAEIAGRRQQVIGRARGRAGALPFTPALARRAEQRKIVARVETDGVPAGQVTVARFRAAPTPKPAAPRVVVRRAGTKLIVRWTPVPRATHYAVRVTLVGGRVLTPTTRATSLTVADAGRGAGATVTVTAIDAADRNGAPGRAKLAASAAGRPTLVL